MRIFFGLIAATLSAAPIGNPNAPHIIQQGILGHSDSWLDMRLGYEGDFVSNGLMQQALQGSGRVDVYEAWTNSGVLTLNILDRIDVYGLLGASRTKAEWRFENEGAVTRIALKTEYNFLWAVGGRTIFYEWNRASLGLGGRYTASAYHPEHTTSNGALVNAQGSLFHWHEWQVNLDLTYHISLFTPYIGAKYSYAKTDLKDFPVPISASGTGDNSFKNETPVGLYLGCSLSNGKYFMFNIEARLIDEEAVSVSGDFRF